MNREYIELIKVLTSIPAPSHKERRKAEYIRDVINNKIEEYNYKYVDMNFDKADNLIIEFLFRGIQSATVFMAHTDTVFEDEIIIVKEDDEKIYGPGVGDDTTNVAAMIRTVFYIIENNLIPQNKIFIVFNSCEEGLGNLFGTKTFFDEYEKNIEKMISFDGEYKWLVNKAVGSYRYSVKIKTQGGHSFGDFGNENSIVVASSIVCDLYKIDTKILSGKTTYNVGVIDGGTSVNTICEECEFLFEIRSDERESIDRVEKLFFEILEKYRDRAEINYEIIGKRPSMGSFDEKSYNKLMEMTQGAKNLIYEVTGEDVKGESGSTDCNIPLSVGIPSICYGGYKGSGWHTKGEYVLKNSLEKGYEIIRRSICEYFD